MNRDAIGLDFGTSTTLLASADGIVPIGESIAWMPSVVGYDDGGCVVAGEPAADLPADQAIRSIKRSITDGRVFVRIDTPTGIRDIRADDLIVELLREAVGRGETAGESVREAGSVRLGCPAMWDGAQRRRLIEAAGRAGLSVTLANLVDEPVAAGIAWLSGSGLAAPGPVRVLVFDMGGGTLDIAVLDVRGVHRMDVSVLAALGVAEAGDTLDEAIAEDLEYALAAMGVDIDDLPHPSRARKHLGYAAEKAKIALTASAETLARLPRREFTNAAPIEYTRTQLNKMFEPQMDRAEYCVAAALRAARLTEMVAGSASDILRTPIERLVEGVDVVVLSGGMAQVPYVAERLRALFPDQTRIEMAGRPSENAVAIGLAQAAGYGRVNMYRPGFDLLVEWDDGAEVRTIYEAYTPLIAAWQIAQGGRDLRYVRNGLDLSLPRKGRGRLRIVSRNGARVRASLGGANLDGFLVALNDKFEFSIYPNGRIQMSDDGATYDGHIDNWHAMERYSASATRSSAGM